MMTLGIDHTLYFALAAVSENIPILVILQLCCCVQEGGGEKKAPTAFFFSWLLVQFFSTAPLFKTSVRELGHFWHGVTFVSLALLKTLSVQVHKSLNGLTLFCYSEFHERQQSSIIRSSFVQLRVTKKILNHLIVCN